MVVSTISVVDPKILLPILGTHDQHLKLIRDALGVQISTRGNEIRIEGEELATGQATEILVELKRIAQREGAVDPEQVRQIISAVTTGAPLRATTTLDVMAAGRKITPRTQGQHRYVEAIQKHDIVFCQGPAGTGKTYLAVAAAVDQLKRGRVRKLVLVRPAVEAGESLGYLPGDLQAKINPYLRPLLDALREMMDYELIKRYTEQDLIEVIPLAYMRGRTLNESFIILDEAQNTTVSQMKMFLTRMGRQSKIVVSGDTTQVDLPPHTKSGLVDAVSRLDGIEGIARIMLTGADIVRHRLVMDIVRAYEEGPSEVAGKNERRRNNNGKRQ